MGFGLTAASSGPGEGVRMATGCAAVHIVAAPETAAVLVVLSADVLCWWARKAERKPPSKDGLCVGIMQNPLLHAVEMGRWRLGMAVVARRSWSTLSWSCSRSRCYGSRRRHCAVLVVVVGSSVAAANPRLHEGQLPVLSDSAPISPAVTRGR